MLLLSLGARRCSRTYIRLARVSRGRRPWLGVGVFPGLLGVIGGTCTSSFATILAFSTAFRLAFTLTLALAIVTAFGVRAAIVFALASLAIGFRLPFSGQSLLVVALVRVVVPASAKSKGGSAPLVIRHLQFAAGIHFLLLASYNIA